MKLIIGLGNPGASYADTRHNIGRMIVCNFAERHQLPFPKKRNLKASISQLDLDGTSVILAYPEVFMNLSGESVLKLVNHFGVDFQKELLIIIDDFALPFGDLRLRPRGSDGGHKGLRSIQAQLGSSEYARLRIGIGPTDVSEESSWEPLEEFVLSPFSSKDKKKLPQVLARGYEACRLWISQPIENAMNVVNANK